MACARPGRGACKQVILLLWVCVCRIAVSEFVCVNRMTGGIEAGESPEWMKQAKDMHLAPAAVAVAMGFGWC